MLESRPGILVIAHRFAPYSRVGAYRWVRLCCRLARRGHQVHVLSVRWPNMEPMDWLSEAQEPGIFIHRTRSGYPQRLQYGRWSSAIADRWVGRSVRYLARKFPSYDEASPWGRWLVPEAIRLCDLHRLGAVVATGGPFSPHYFASQIKQQRPRVALVQDFRDPWFLSLEEAERAGWRERYEQSLSLADAVVGVTPEMTELLKEHCPRPQKFETIENGVDLSHLRSISASHRPGKEPTDFVYAGSIYSDRHVPLEAFFSWMRGRRQRGAPVRLELIGRMDRRLPSLCGDLVDVGDVELRDTMPQSLVFERILEGKRALHLNAPRTNNTQVSTKILEYAALGKPTVSLNYGGAVDSLIRSSGLGWSLDASSLELDSQLDAVCQSDEPFAPKLDRFDFETLADRYSRLLVHLAERAQAGSFPPRP